MRNLERLPKTVVTLTKEHTRGEADKFLEHLRNNILGQKLSLAPLSPKYKRYKELHGYDTRILISTGEYVDKLKVKEVSYGKNVQGYFVGAFEEDTHVASGQSMATIARWLEYGTYNMPPRPHIFPSWEQFKGGFNSRFRSFLSSLLAQIWR